MKKIPIIITLLLAPLTAVPSNTCLRLSLSDGSGETYLLDEQPVLTYPGQNLLINTSKISTEYPREEVKKIDFIDDTNSSVEVQDMCTTYSFADNVVYCEGNEIQVYDISGQKVATGFDQVSLRELPSGIYIINIKKQTIKLIKR